jgi:hypothetical protein
VDRKPEKAAQAKIRGTKKNLVGLKPESAAYAKKGTIPVDRKLERAVQEKVRDFQKK